MYIYFHLQICKSVMQQLMAGDIAGAGGHSSDISDSTDEKG